MYIYQHQSKDLRRVCFVITLIVKNNQQMRHCIHQDPPLTIKSQEIGAFMIFKTKCIRFVNNILKLVFMKKKIEKRLSN